MNKIVREHYPVSKLPEDLRGELDLAGSVKVTIEGRLAAPARIRSILEESRKLREAGVIPTITEQEAVERVRCLRDE